MYLHGKRKIWWEPCIEKVTPYCLLPDTICGECTENVDNFYMFIKNCLQNIIILEAQYDIQESCLKSKQKKDKGCYVDFQHKKINKGNQTEDYLDVISGKKFDFDNLRKSFPLCVNFLDNQDDFIRKNINKLVDYEVDSDSSLEEHFQNEGRVILNENFESDLQTTRLLNIFATKNDLPIKTQYFDDSEKNLISEISQRKKLKRKNDFIETSKPKIYKVDTSNRRKNKVPKKLDTQEVGEESNVDFGNFENKIECETQNRETETTLHNFNNQNEKLLLSLPQSCLLCDTHFSGPSALATHVFEVHGIDMAEVVSSGSGESFPEKSKKKLPNLVKISDLKKTDSLDDNHYDRQLETQSTKHSDLCCPNCSSIFTSKQDLMMHLKLKHAQLAGFVCGICLHQCSSLMNLKSHLETCTQQNPINNKYVCQVCQYGDENFKWLENHVLVHEFLQEACKKRMKMFDPEDYIDINENTCYKGLSCTECGLDEFFSFKEFSAHRRNNHNIFHCDLCNKFYGRNSHLWKHVNRLHKGHPSITCQMCYKTSASKYHLSQHFNKIHLAKSSKKSNHIGLIEKENKEESTNKFSAFDFLSIRENFLKQELVENSEQDDNSNQHSDGDEDMIIKEEFDDDSNMKEEHPLAPKEIDSSHDMYNNIITNYTPPINEGDFKCPKCSKGFNKKLLLKKHKKNCRPRMQKDLLTRCKTCSRVFKDRQSLAKHLINYHSEYSCEICLEKVQSKCEIVSHIRFRHPGCPLFCRICKNILRCKSDMQEHVRNHFDSHVCQFCGDSLPSKIKLKMHILSLHRKILSLSCGICLKLFENQYVLRDHVKLVHKDQLTPHTSCSVCGKNYGSKWKTYDHINKSHGRIFRACKTCLEIFDNDAQLQAHCDVTAHGGQIGNNANAAALRNSIMAHIKSALIVNHEEDSITDEDGNSESEFDNESAPYEEDRKFFFPIQDDAKISLLEKRLIGKTLADEEINIKPKLPVTKKSKSLSSSKSKQSITIKKEDPDNTQANCSKRTVYVNSNDPSYCEICYKTWPAKKHLWQHYIRCHKSIAATVCGICLKTNTDYESLQQHLRDNHPKLLHGQGFGSNFICKICGRYHNASSKLRLHMVIHDNFDWKLIEAADKDIKPANGFKVKEEPHFEDNINYDSLIEQVECSSETDNDESDDNEPQVKQQDSSSSEEDGRVGSEDDSALSWNQKEANPQIQQSQDAPQQHHQYSSSSEDSTSSYCRSKCSSSDDDCSQESRSVSSQFQNKFAIKTEPFHPISNLESVDDDDDVLNATNNANMFDRKPEELDSAIKSISYDDCIETVDLNVVDDYCDIQNNCLNENEIESAVGSIL